MAGKSYYHERLWRNGFYDRGRDVVKFADYRNVLVSVVTSRFRLSQGDHFSRRVYAIISRRLSVLVHGDDASAASQKQHMGAHYSALVQWVVCDDYANLFSHDDPRCSH
ncbi:hypothetical protein D3C84_1005370 [compost metagenome]